LTDGDEVAILEPVGDILEAGAISPSDSGVPASVGRALRRARQRRHATIDEAAETTRIPKRFLEALERDAPADEYPAPAYARAFLREYAGYLGLEPERLVQAFMARNGAQEPSLESLAKTMPPERRHRGSLGVLAFLIVATAVTVGVVRLGSSNHGSATQPGPPAINTRPAAAPSTPASPPPTVTPPRKPHSGIRLVLSAQARCWLQATADGQTILTGFLNPGEHKVLHAKRTLDLRLGNAGGVQLLANGRSVHTGSSGQVISLSFAWKGGRVVLA